MIYKIKIGNFLPDALYKTNFNFLINSLNQKSVTGRKSVWFTAKAVIDTLNTNQQNLHLKNKFDFISYINSVPSSLSLKHYIDYKKSSTLLRDLFFSQAKSIRILNN